MAILDELELAYLGPGDLVNVDGVIFSLAVDDAGEPMPLPSDDVIEWAIQRRLHDDPLAGGMDLVDNVEDIPSRDTTWVAASLPRDVTDREFNDRNIVLLANGFPVADEDITGAERDAVIEGFFQRAAARVMAIIPMLDRESIEMGTFRVQSDLAQTRPGGRLEAFIAEALEQRYGAQLDTMPAMQVPPPPSGSKPPTAPDTPSWGTPDDVQRDIDRLGRSQWQDDLGKSDAYGQAMDLLEQVIASQGGQIPAGVSLRVVPAGLDQLGRAQPDGFVIGLSLDYGNEAHRRFRDAVVAQFPESIRVLTPPPFPPRHAAQRSGITLDT